MTPEQWTRVISTNVNSLYNVTHPAIKNMMDNNGGKIINVSSIYGLMSGRLVKNHYRNAVLNRISQLQKDGCF